MSSSARAKPLNLGHHFSKASKRRSPNVLKEYYKFLRVPEMGNLAGGLPDPGNFPFSAMELSVVHPESLLTSDSPGNPGRGASCMRIPRRADGPDSVRKIDLATALQNGGALGYPPLYSWLRKLTNSVYHPNIPYKDGADIIISGGSADGLSKVFELLFDPWDEDLNDIRDRQGLLDEEFVYGTPIAQVKPKNVNIVPVKMDGAGMLAYGNGSLYEILQNWDPAKGSRPHVVYLIPTGQNPTSGVLSLPRRRELYEVCCQFDLVLIEDDPYWNLYYPSTQSSSAKDRGSSAFADFPTDPNHNYCTQDLKGKSTGYQFLDELVPSFLSIDKDGRVIRLDSFSKTVAPGCRLGWITAQPGICEQVFRITDGTTQQPSGFSQAIVAQLIGDFGDPNPTEPNETSVEQSAGWGLHGWVRWLEGLRSAYQHRMTVMATILEENRFVVSKAGQKEMFSFNWPMGGMFLWVKVNISTHPLTSIDPRRLMLALWTYCTQHPYRILVVPGGDFAANGTIKVDQGYQFLRFCFASVEESVLKVKSRAFAEACQSFWAIDSVEAIDIILQEEDVLQPEGQDSEDDVLPDREVIDEWQRAG